MPESSEYVFKNQQNFNANKPPLQHDLKRKGFARLKGTFRMPFTTISTNNLALHKSKDDSVKNCKQTFVIYYYN